jgi:3D (Asp-Asp-Asp) domain-containing protein
MAAASGIFWLRGVKRVLRWWFAALLDRRGRFAGMRLLLTGVMIGLIGGYSVVRVYRVALIEEKHLPKPVVAAPVGMAWVNVLTTGYCPCVLCCGVFSDGRTAINRNVLEFPFGIAVEPKLVPYRTWVDIPGYGLAMVDDTGGAMRQSGQKKIVHFDLRFETHGQARQWGRRWMYVALPATGPAALLTPVP